MLSVKSFSMAYGWTQAITFQSPSYYTPILKSANGYILKGLPVLKISGYQDAFIPLET